MYQSDFPTDRIHGKHYWLHCVAAANLFNPGVPYFLQNKTLSLVSLTVYSTLISGSLYKLCPLDNPNIYYIKIMIIIIASLLSSSWCQVYFFFHFGDINIVPLITNKTEDKKSKEIIFEPHNKKFYWMDIYRTPVLSIAKFTFFSSTHSVFT